MGLKFPSVHHSMIWNTVYKKQLISSITSMSVCIKCPICVYILSGVLWPLQEKGLSWWKLWVGCCWFLLTAWRPWWWGFFFFSLKCSSGFGTNTGGKTRYICLFRIINQYWTMPKQNKIICLAIVVKLIIIHPNGMFNPSRQILPI